MPQHALTGQARAQRRAAALIVLIYLLLIFEGAVRKWVLPSFGQWLFFVRDPLVLAVYWLAIRHSLFPRHQPLLVAGLAFAAVGLLLIVLQSFGGNAALSHWPLLATYGWRNYFLYIPLPFVIGQVLEPADLRRITKLTLFLAIPMALLVLLQFRSSPTAPINVGFGGNVEQQFHGLGLDEDHTRPMGTFTSDVGEKHFIASSIALALAVWLLPPSRRYIKRFPLALATIGALSCLGLSGSRGAMMASGVIMLAAAASAIVIKGSGSRALLLPVLIVLLAVALYPIAFPDGYAEFVYRWTSAAAVESQSYSLGILGRALYGFVDFISFIGDAPLAGYGLGFSGNARTVLGITIQGLTDTGETDYSRHIVELGPIVGCAFIVYRIVLTAWVGKACLAGARATGNPLPLLLFAYIGLELLYGQISGNGAVNGYTWLFTGFCLAAARSPAPLGASAAARGAPVASVAAALPFPNLMR